MAINGKIKGITYRSNGNENGDYDFYLNWTRNSYSIENNTSNVSITLTVRRNDGYKDSAANLDKKPTVTLSIKGESIEENISTSYINTRNGQTSTFMTWSGDLAHNDDGSFEADVAANFSLSGTSSLGRGEVSGKIQLDTIPRATPLESFLCDSDFLDGTLTYIIGTKASEKFSHTLTLYIDNAAVFSGDETDFSNGSFQISSLDWGLLDNIYEALGNQSQGTLSLGLKTKSGEVQVGGEQKISLVLKIPDEVKPSVDNFTFSLTKWSELLQDQNQITVDFVDAVAGTGAQIKGYEVTVYQEGEALLTKQFTSLPMLLGPFQKFGWIIISIKAIDGRDRVSEEKTETIYCYEYSLPSIPEFRAYRANSEGKEDANGTWLKCTYTANCAEVDGENFSSVTIFVDGYEQSSFHYDTGDNSKSHQVYLTISDKYYSNQKTGTITVLGASRTINVAADGLGIAFGKKSEVKKQNNSRVPTFECAWNAEFYGDLKIARAKDAIINLYSLLDIIYPIGSIYTSTQNENPKELFGFGEWSPITGRFLYAADDSDETMRAGSSGGSSTTVLTTDNLPAHNHKAESTYSGANFDIRSGSSDDRYLVAAGSNTTVGSGEGAKKWNSAFSISSSAPNRKNDKVFINGTVTTTIEETGSGKAFSNMPPYLAVYMWRRVE